MSILRTSIISGAVAIMLAGLGAAPAFALWNPDPYTYDYSPQSTAQSARADVGSMQDQGSVSGTRQAIYDSHGHQIGFAQFSSPAK